MQQKLMRFLNACGLVVRHENFVLRLPARRAAAPEHGDGDESALPGGLQRAQHVRRIAARRKDDQHIARIAERFDLPRKDLRKRKIIADAGQQGAIRRKRDGRQRAALAQIMAGELGSQMLRLARAAAVAA